MLLEPCQDYLVSFLGVRGLILRGYEREGKGEKRRTADRIRLIGPCPVLNKGELNSEDILLCSGLTKGSTTSDGFATALRFSPMPPICGNGPLSTSTLTSAKETGLTPDA